jgi:hypothetical protein
MHCYRSFVFVCSKETVPFLYESFETALVDQFPNLAEEMLTVFGEEDMLVDLLVLLQW